MLRSSQEDHKGPPVKEVLAKEVHKLEANDESHAKPVDKLVDPGRNSCSSWSSRRCSVGMDRVHFFQVRVEYDDRASSTSCVLVWSFEYKSSFKYELNIRIDFLSGLNPFPKVLLSLVQTNFGPTEYMKLPEKCELSNLFYKATFHFRLDLRQTRN